MAMLTFSPCDREIAEVVTGEFRDEIISLSYKYDGKRCKESHKFIEVDLPLDCNVFPIPDYEAEHTYVSGPTRCGKSFFVAQYIRSIIQIHPKYKIFLFSDTKKDKNLDRIPNLKRVELDKTLLTDPVKI